MYNLFEFKIYIPREECPKWTDRTTCPLDKEKLFFNNIYDEYYNEKVFRTAAIPHDLLNKEELLELISKIDQICQCCRNNQNKKQRI